MEKCIIKLVSRRVRRSVSRPSIQKSFLVTVVAVDLHLDFGILRHFSEDSRTVPNISEYISHDRSDQTDFKMVPSENAPLYYEVSPFTVGSLDINSYERILFG